MKFFKKFLKDDAGATAIEYGLIAAATGLVLVGLSGTLGVELTTLFETITEGLQNAAPA